MDQPAPADRYPPFIRRAIPRGPATPDSLVGDLRELGLQRGNTVLVHSSLSALGYVIGGAAVVVDALREVVGPSGTLVMPTHSGDLSDPRNWQHPPIPEEWWPLLREHMPAFDPDVTPTRMMGAIADAFWRRRTVLRSNHHSCSFAAEGPHAERITTGQTLSGGFGEDSPLDRVYELDGSVLLLAVGHDRNTSLHYAEYRAAGPDTPRVIDGAPVLVAGERRWVEYEDIDLVDADELLAMGASFEAAVLDEVRTGQVGNASAKLFRQRPLVDHAESWLRAR